MGKKPRVGVFVCDCGVNIAGVVDVKDVTKHSGKMKDVVVAMENEHLCSEPGQELIKKAIKEHNLNRAVVAACSPKMHQHTFRKVCEDAGLNPYLFEMANIREQCSWVHMNEPRKATVKAKDITRMSVARARLLEPQKKVKVKVTNKALVIGGGVAGIQASLDLAEQGFKVYLVEKEPSIGGHMAQLDKTFPTMDCSACILAPKMVDAARHENIELLTNSEVKEVRGYVGNFKVRVEARPRFVKDVCTACDLCSQVCPVEVPNEFDLGLGKRKAIYVPFPQAVPMIYVIDEENCIGCGLCEAVCSPEAINFDDGRQVKELEVGTIIVATGYDIFDATRREEYGYGRYDNVINALEFERLINSTGPTSGKVLRPSDGKEPRSIAFIQCVGSRDEKTNKYCSRVCCMYAIKNARIYKERYRDREVYIFYMDIRAFGKGYEEFYKTSQEEYGIKFIKGRPAEILEKSVTNNLIIRAEDALLGEVVEAEVELVVLSVGLEPRKDSEKLQRILNISRGADGFFLEAHPKLRPIDMVIDGIFLAGASQGPKDIPDAVAQGSAAASRAAILMARGEVEIDPIVAIVDEDLCIGCRICEKACFSSAIDMVNRKAKVKEALCKGCGVCAGACPTGAMQIRHFKDSQIDAQIHAAFAEEFEE